MVRRHIGADSIVALGPHLSILRSFLVPLLLKLLLDLLWIMKMGILIKLSLLKTVDAIMGRDTLMLLILVQTSATVRLPREEVLLLKVLRVVLIVLQNVLLAAVSLVRILAVWSSWIRSLARCGSVHQLIFIELIDHITWCTLRFLVAKDIARGEGVGRTGRRAGASHGLLLSDWLLGGAQGQRWSNDMLFWHVRILVYFSMFAKGWLFLVHFWNYF